MVHGPDRKERVRVDALLADIVAVIQRDDNRVALLSCFQTDLYRGVVSFV